MISTATLALQEQLVNKDLPLFQPHCQPTFTFTPGQGPRPLLLSPATAEPGAGRSQIGLFEATDALTPEQQAQLTQLWRALQDSSWAGDRTAGPSPLMMPFGNNCKPSATAVSPQLVP
ncbi:hypothetical protein MBH78_14770 [Oceanimonas sp. NS1]|nr:hypothetical protein [Oceanimonas sp. NS1]